MAERNSGFERNHKAVHGAKLAGMANRVLFTQHSVVINLDCGISGQIDSKASR